MGFYIYIVHKLLNYVSQRQPSGQMMISVPLPAPSVQELSPQATSSWLWMWFCGTLLKSLLKSQTIGKNQGRKGDIPRIAVCVKVKEQCEMSPKESGVKWVGASNVPMPNFIFHLSYDSYHLPTCKPRAVSKPGDWMLPLATAENELVKHWTVNHEFENINGMGSRSWKLNLVAKKTW